MWPLRVQRVAGAELLRSAVEGEELGRSSCEPRRHRDEIRVDREVDDGAPRERDVHRIAVAPVLRDRVLDILARERVLQLGRRDRDPVQ